MKDTSELLGSKPFEKSSKFLKSFRENAQHHYLHHPYIKKIWDEEKINPGSIQTEEDLKKAPFIMVSLFKEHEFVTGPREEIVLHLTSSGTGGMKSHQFLNQLSLENVKKSAYEIHHALGITSSKKYNYFCFTYDPKVANDLGTAFTDELLTSFTEKNEVYYTFQWDDSKKDFIFDQKKALEKLIEFSKSEYSTRILGFPAFLHQLVTENNLKLNLGSDSWIQTGGGWKGLKDKEIPKTEFRKLMSVTLGIPEKNIRDMFGMVEHGIPYVDCSKGKLHIPNFARVFIRRATDLSFLPKGEEGLMQFICTYNSSYPSFNILSTDYGKIETCDCEIGGDVLIPTGRAGITKHKGCAIKALDLLEGIK